MSTSIGFILILIALLGNVGRSRSTTNGLEEKLEFTIEEGVPPGTIVGRIQKRDGYAYRLNERNRFFVFNTSSGELRTTDTADAPLLDRESLERYGYKRDEVDFVILGTATSLSAATIAPSTYFVAVTVRVIDINDNAPSFPFAFQNVSLPESARVGTRLILASATDSDEGENGRIKDYRLIGGNDDETFHLGRGGGSTTNGGDGDDDRTPEAVYLELQHGLDRESRALYILNISATDGAIDRALTGYLTVFVNVLDSNDNRPVFERTQYGVSVSENLPAGSSILMVTATDKDNGENARITYSIGNDLENQFRVNPESGVVSTNTAPLRCAETRSTTSTTNATRLCTFTIEAVDGGVPAQRGRTFVNVELFDVNDHAPEISFRFYSPTSGGGSETAPAAIVDETKPIGTVVAVVTVIDPDHGENGRTTVSIVGGNESGHFRLESNDLFSVIRTNAVLKRTTIDKYNLTVMANDRGQPSKYSIKTMIIYVNDANDRPPVFDRAEYRATIAENSPTGAFVMAVCATSSSINERRRSVGDSCPIEVWYELVNNDTNSSSGNSSSSGVFHLDSKTGLITVVGRLDYEVDQRNFTLTVGAKDACRPSLRTSTAIVRIEVEDVNDRVPTFAEEMYEVEIYENTTVGSVVLKLRAVDGDSGENGRITYSLDGGADQFAIQSSTGNLIVSSALDRERTDSYKLRAIAIDHGSPPLQSTATIRVRVLDIDDNAPRFRTSEYYVNLRPFDPPGMVLAKIRAEDPDVGINGDVSYFFLEQPPVNSLSVGQKSGELYLKSRMTISSAIAGNRFDVVLGAVDGGGLRASNNATVHVFVVQDLGGEANSTGAGGLPRFAKDSYVLRVREDAGGSVATDGVSKSIGTVSATDSDAPLTTAAGSSSIQYRIVDGDEANLFDIGPYSGELRSRRKIDYEEASEYTLTVAALGRLGVAVVRVKLDVEDLNDNAPRFLTAANETKATVGRSRPAGYGFYGARARDADSGSNGRIKYSLKATDVEVSKYFAIDQESGTLFLKTPAYAIPTSTFVLTVVATDSGTPPLSATTTVRVSIIDDDVDSRSIGWFPKATYDFAVWENARVNSRLIKLNLTKPCGGGGWHDCEFRVDEGNEDDAFGVFPDGWLYVKNELDYEKRSSFQLNVEARRMGGGDRGGEETKETKTVSVINLQLIDVNDNTPTCANDTFRFRLLEHSTSPSTYVGTVSAEDFDTGLNGDVKYRLLPDSENFAADFHIGTSSGIITALRQFDREHLVKTRNSPTITLHFEAEDFGGELEPKRVRCKVDVEITDTNDHAPQFALDIYAVSIPENQEVGSEILRLTASDEDRDENAAVEFSIVDGDDEPERRFWINSTSGQLLLRRPLDREERSSYVLELMARDFGRPQRLNSTAFATVFVSDVNDNAPMFLRGLPSRIVFSESTPIGTVLARLTATDADSGPAGSVRYSLTKGNSGQTFELDPITGDLILVRSLDYETQRNFTLTVWASDQGAPSLMNTTELTIDVLDENDNAPVITTPIMVAQIAETAPVGTGVFTVKADDADSGSNGTIRFALIDQKPTAAFGIQPETGAIFVAGRLDSDTADVYSILVEARDSCEREHLRLSTKRLITVLLIDADPIGPFGGPRATVLTADRATVGSTIESIPPAAAYAYGLMDGGDSDWFKLSPRGVLSLKSPLPTSSKSVYELKIQATGNDSTRVLSEHTVIVDSGRSSSVRFEKSRYEFRMLKNSINGTELGRIALAQTAGAGSSIDFYVINSALSPNSSFEDTDLAVDIDRSTGVVYSTGLLRRKRYRTKRMDTVRVEVVAVVDGTSVTRCEVFITIQPPTEESIKFSENFYQFQVNEDVRIGSTIGHVKILTPGISNNASSRSLSVRFAISNRTTAVTLPFDINAETGAIVVTQQLDRERAAYHDLEIRAEDTSGVPIFASVRVDVLDINDNEPRFENGTTTMFKVIEGAQKGAFVGKVTATDEDAGTNGEIRYSLIAAELGSYFSVDSTTGVIRVAGNLDREENPVFFLTIQATDHGNPPRSSTTTIFVEVVDVNDNSPVFQRSFYEVSVLENATIGTALLQLTATDLDTDTDFAYAIVSGNVWGRFDIDDNGTLTVASPLDRETRPTYHLVVTVYDQPPTVAHRRSASAQVTVNLLDVNDFAPRFIPESPDWTSVGPRTPPGTVLTTVKAVDMDESEAGVVNYLLDPKKAGLFRLDAITGELRLAYVPTAAAMHNLTIWAYDRGTPSLYSSWNLTVYVSSDHRSSTPTFVQKSMEMSVSEDTPAGKSLLQMTMAQTTDDGEDDSDNSIRFWIVGSQSDGADFEVTPDTGILTVARPLDYERKTTYNLTVAVAPLDALEPSDSTIVLVRIKDVNDNAPIFHRSPVYFDVVEGEWTGRAVGVGLVTAMDADSGVNGKLSYSIIQGNTSVFSIDSLNGELRMQGRVDREAVESYVLTVEAADSGSPRRTATTSVVITVLDVNDNDPIFDKPSYVGVVRENQPAGTVVLQVSASDADRGENGLISFKLDSKDQHLSFSIDERTGEIRTKSSLDRESRDQYEFVVMASDGGDDESSVGESRTSTVHVRVRVEDENDNTPAFIDTSQDIYISAANSDFVYVVGAEDADEGENARLRYALAGRDAKHFDISPSTGVIRWRRSVGPKPSTNDFSLDVFVSDSDAIQTRNASTSLRFFPRAAADFPDLSETRNRNFSVFENRTNVEILRIVGRSPKRAPANRISYSIASGNIGGAFAIDSMSGRLSTTSKLDYELERSYELYVAATDADNPPLASFAKIEIHLDDCNDNAPVFEETSFSATVLEEEPAPLEVARVKATDADSESNGRIRYSIRQNEPNGVGNFFEIDSETGLITTKAALDREKNGEYRIVVEAVDDGNPPLSSTVPVIVRVTDINDNAPKFTRLFAANVREDAAVGTFVTQVTSSDADRLAENTNNSYYLSVNPGHKFAIDPRMGAVRVNGSLDRESVPEYQLKVVAVDGSWRVETSLTVTIADVNDNAPKFSHDQYSFNVSESQPPLTLVGKVQATDRDETGPNSKVTYRLAEKSSLFVVDSQNGEIRTSKTLRRRQSSDWDSDFYDIRVIAEDGGRPILQSTTSVTVRVIEKRTTTEPLFAKRSIAVAIPTEVAKGTKIWRPTIRQGEIDRIQFALEQQGEEFEIDSSSGWITTSQSISAPVGTQYRLTILADDSSSLDVTLVITEVNKNSPEFSSPTYSVNIAENATPGSAIFTVSARDYDKGLNAKVTYSCVGNRTTTMENPCELFSIDEETGVIVLNERLDYERAKSYVLVLSAADGGYESKKAFSTLRINIQDVNDNPPRFVFANGRQLIARIRENAPKGTAVIRLNCTDEDSPPYDSIVYSIETSDRAGGRFVVDADTGLITVVGKIDYELESEYQLKVKCKNPDSPLMFSTTTLTIRVDGVNEFAPRFQLTEYVFETDRTTTDGTAVGVVRAVDEDAGADGLVYYSIKLGDGTGGLAVNELTGEITINKRIGQQNSTSAIVLAQNRRISSPADIAAVKVTVVFSSIGGDYPRFTSKKQFVEIAENASIGTIVARLNVTGARRPIFELISGNDGNAFNVDRSTGAIRVASKLDRETVDSYSLTVKATANANATVFSTATIGVTITDINDNPPYLSESAAIGRILENEPNGTTIMSLVPSDRDSPTNRGPYTFALLDSPSSSLFDLDSTSGVLKSKAVFDRETVGRYSISIKIADSGQPSLWAVSNVTVVVEDANDQLSSVHPIRATILAYQSTIPSDSSVLGAVFPDDPDSVGDYTCQLRSGNDSIGGKLSVRSDCRLIRGAAISVPSKFKFSLAGTDGLHEWVNYEAEVEFEHVRQDWIENSVFLTVRGDAGRLAKTFVEQLNAALIKTDGAKSSAKLVHVSPKISIFDRDIEAAVIVLDERGSPRAFAHSVQLLRAIAGDSALEDFEIKNIFGGFCSPSGSNTSTSLCANRGSCHELVTADHSNYNFVVETSTSTSFPTLTRSYRCECPSEFDGRHCEIAIDRCAAHSCANGATCVYDRESDRVRCQCPDGFAGANCDEDIDECTATPSPCLNNGWCENTRGSYRCVCMVGFAGARCESSTTTSGGYCSSNPCTNGGRCTDTKDGYSCECEFGFAGDRCELGSMGFDYDSYLELRTNGSVTSLQFEFATISLDTMLVYAPIGDRQFVAIEVSDGYLRIVGTDGTVGDVETKIGTKMVNDGAWKLATITYGGTELEISIGECDKDDRSCRAGVEVSNTNPLAAARSLFFGTTRDFAQLAPSIARLSAPGFVGCLRNLRANGRSLGEAVISRENILDHCPRSSQPPCSSSNRANGSSWCGDGEKCQDGWSRPVCNCAGGFSSSNCKSADDSVTFAGQGYIAYTLSESYRRRLLFAESSSSRSNPDETYRFRRSAASSHYPRQWTILEFRTLATDGILFFAMTSSNEFTLIDVVNGSVRYMSRSSKDSRPMQITLNDGPYVSDGEWHLVSLALQSSGNEVEFRIDNFGKDAHTDGAVRLHSIVSSNLSTASIGGSAESLKISGIVLRGLEGCIRKFIVNGVLQPLRTTAGGDSSFFESKTVGEVGDGCDSATICPTSTSCNDGERGHQQSARFNTSLMAVLVFFGCMIVSTFVAFVIVRKIRNRRQKKAAGCASSLSTTSSERAAFVNGGATVANISTLSDLVRMRREDEDGCPPTIINNLNGSMKDSGIVLGVSRQTLDEDGSQISLNNPMDAAHHHRTERASTISASTYLTNYLQEPSSDNRHQHRGNRGGAFSSNPFVERYDLDDASSLAPSDADVAKHYRDYRQHISGGPRKLPSKFVPPRPPPPAANGGDPMIVPSLFGGTTSMNYSSTQSLAAMSAARNRKSPGLRATPTSVLAMMPESESSDEVMMQRNVRAPTTVRETPESMAINNSANQRRPESNRSLRARQQQRRQQTGGGERASARLRKSQRGSTKSRTRRQQQRNADDSDASEMSTSSSDAVTATPTSHRGGSIKSNRRTTPGAANPTTPRILSPRAPPPPPPVHSSTADEFSDSVSAALRTGEFDLDQMRKPRRFLQQPDDTETESDVLGTRRTSTADGQQQHHRKGSFALDQFIPGPRTLFLMSEDEQTTDMESDSRHHRGPRNRSPPHPSAPGLEAYV